MCQNSVIAFLLIVCLSSIAYAQRVMEVEPAIAARIPIEKTFKMDHNLPSPETRQTIAPIVDPTFAIRAGGDLFNVKFGRDVFRYEYNNEWIEFQPLNHRPVSLLSAANWLYYRDYWTDTDLRFKIHDYGVKVDIVLTADSAPRQFSFHYSKSKNWQDRWILSAFCEDNNVVDVPLAVTNKDGVLTYSLPADLSVYAFPITIDPTFDVGTSGDDAVARIRTSLDENYDTALRTYFGRCSITSENTGSWAYFRFVPTIPRGSKILTSNFSFYAELSSSDAFNTTIEGLARDGKWDDADGFDSGTDYTTGSALNAITPLSTSITWSSVAPWTAGSWYDSPDITSLLQDQVDTLAGTNEFDPLDSAKRYLGYRIDDGDGTYGDITAGDIRYFTAYDDTASLAAELDITYEPWGEIRTGNGMKYNSDCGCYQYFDY